MWVRWKKGRRERARNSLCVCVWFCSSLNFHATARSSALMHLSTESMLKIVTNQRKKDSKDDASGAGVAAVFIFARPRCYYTNIEWHILLQFVWNSLCLTSLVYHLFPRCDIVFARILLLIFICAFIFHFVSFSYHQIYLHIKIKKMELVSSHRNIEIS